MRLRADRDCWPCTRFAERERRQLAVRQNGKRSAAGDMREVPEMNEAGFEYTRSASKEAK